MVSKDFIRQLEGYGLTTATILYRMPDHPQRPANLYLAAIRPGAALSGAEGFPGILGAGTRRAAAFGHGFACAA